MVTLANEAYLHQLIIDLEFAKGELEIHLANYNESLKQLNYWQAQADALGIIIERLAPVPEWESAPSLKFDDDIPF